MENNVISLVAHRAQLAADLRADIRVVRIEPAPKSQAVATSEDLVRLMRSLIVRVRDGRFNQRATTYRELDVIARKIERELGVAPGTWV